MAAIFVFIQWGPATESTLWLVQQGRKYVEAPRWAAVGIALVLLVFAWNVIGTAVKAKRITGIMAVLSVNMVPLVLLYFIAFPAIPDMATDLYWWWWLVHLWVEATWEILIGCIMALAVMQLLGTSRRIVEGWLYIEVMLVLGTGILGLGHHYFWIGTPDYWLGIGGFFSALEPLPLLGMVVHAIYDAGTHRMKTTNRPAFYWTLAEAFGNFLGGGVFGFMITLPQLNLFAHGTQWTVSHGHFAFWGAYACGVISVCYLALQKLRAQAAVEGRLWIWSFGLLNAGLIGMVGSLLVRGCASLLRARHRRFDPRCLHRRPGEPLVRRGDGHPPRLRANVRGRLCGSGVGSAHDRQASAGFVGCRRGCRMNQISLLQLHCSWAST